MKQIMITNKGKVESVDCPSLAAGTPNNLLMRDYILSYPTKIMMHGEQYELLDHRLLDRLLVYGHINMLESKTLRVYY